MNFTIPYAVRPWDGPFAKSDSNEKPHKRYIPAQLPPTAGNRYLFELSVAGL